MSLVVDSSSDFFSFLTQSESTSIECLDKDKEISGFDEEIELSSSQFSSNPQTAKELFKKIQTAFYSVEKVCFNDKDRLIFLVADILAKTFAYQRPPENVEKITIPQLIGKEIISIDYKFAAMDLGHLSIAHILLPIDNTSAHPIIVFRGTVPTSFETVQSTFGFKGTLSLFVNNTWGFGNNVLWTNRKIFSKLLKEIKAKYKITPILIGHSLGGVLAQRFALQGKNINLIFSIFAFNSPGILSSECEKWEKMSKPNKDKIFVINAAGDDVVNHFGSKRFIGKKFIFKPFQETKELIHGKVLLNKAGKFEELKPNMTSIAKKIGVVVFYPFRVVAVLFLLFNAFIFVDIPAFINNRFFCTDAALRRQAKPIDVNSKNLLEDIFENSKIWWRLSASPNKQ